MSARLLVLASLLLASSLKLAAGPLQEGDALFGRQRYALAIAQYEEAKAAGLSPGQAEAGIIACLQKLNRMSEAVERARALVQKYPTSAAAAEVLGDVYFVNGQDAEAIAALEAGLKRNPGHQSLRNALAWVLSTTPSAAHRNGARAVQLATGLRSASRSEQASYTDTLAAAYAEAGRFADAVRTQELAMPGLEGASDSTIRSRSLARQRLANYRANRPWHRRPPP